ncbi:aminotransferase class IV [Lysinibacillus sp. BW-2-10]|uniref:aminotransferase class IV n=1 Tax=Lysinibacillus sp. BW-2-10 TaxID=2590030 RepID=UPI00117EBD0C|nr:aminotransferase class IV [Lysinibacillus sp. BW-2-10]TSI05487.1 4-amino-4-deoxychorismate lyase [Lysinibacillus sp. BW-2-10]
MYCWVNGKVIDERDVHISPFDHGFLYGLGFFEVFRTYQGRVILLEEHFNRLCSSLNHYRISMPYTIKSIENAVFELLKRGSNKDSVFRLNVSAGTAMDSFPLQYKNPNVILFQEALPLRKRGTEKKAIWLKTRRNTPEQHTRFKSHHFGNNILARFEIDNLDTTEGFFLTSKGLVAEGVKSNIFWVRDGILYTPSLVAGIVPGITRQWVIHAAQQFGIPVVEDIFIKSDVENAYECFVTNSIEELVPISKIGRTKFLGESGPVYQRLHHAYIEEIIQTMKRG